MSDSDVAGRWIKLTAPQMAVLAVTFVVVACAVACIVCTMGPALSSLFGVPVFALTPTPTF